MNAIYKGKLYSIIGDNGNEVQLQSLDTDTDMTLWVSYGFGAPDFIIDPTDDQINNILPDYEAIDTAPSEKMAQGFDERLQIATPVDQIVGCNVHGRLTCILALLDAGDLPTVRLELERLLKFFPNPVAKP